PAIHRRCTRCTPDGHSSQSSGMGVGVCVCREEGRRWPSYKHAATLSRHLRRDSVRPTLSQPSANEQNHPQQPHPSTAGQPSALAKPTPITLGIIYCALYAFLFVSSERGRQTNPGKKAVFKHTVIISPRLCNCERSKMW